MEMLYVLYDPKCELCERLKDWLLIQKQWLGLSMVPAGSDKAKKMFPGLDEIATCNDLVVISDDGQVYLNNSAGSWRCTRWRSIVIGPAGWRTRC